MHFKKILGVGLVAMMALTVAVPSASALHDPEHYSLFGAAEYVEPGINSARAVKLSSEASTTLPYSGIDYGVESGLTFADIAELSTDYKFENPDTCGLGSPRFQINVLDSASTTKNIFVYLGSYPNYNDCQSATSTATSTNTGDLLEPGMYVDTSQVGGTFYQLYENALTQFGSSTVTGIQLVVDGPNQTVVVDNTVVDTTIFTYEVPVPPAPPMATTKQECKNGGWRTLGDSDGKAFKNQGDCVSFVATNGKNKANPR